MATSNETQLMPVVTISASYGAGGSVVAPTLAERLGFGFVDRVITSELSEKASGKVRSSESVSPDEQAASPAHRLFTYLARAASVGALMAPEVLHDDDVSLRERAESALRPLLRPTNAEFAGNEAGFVGTEGGAGGGTGPGGAVKEARVEGFERGAVVLGRAGAVVLADRPRTLHVRLDGPPASRAEQAAQLEQIGLEHATARLSETDRSRTLWVRRLYGADATDPSWYHLWIDSTAISLDAVMELIEHMLDALLAKGP